MCGSGRWRALRISDGLICDIEIACYVLRLLLGLLFSPALEFVASIKAVVVVVGFIFDLLGLLEMVPLGKESIFTIKVLLRVAEAR